MGVPRPVEAPATGAVADGGADDLRACWIDVDETGTRFKEWRKVVLESTQEVFSDAAVRGPPSFLEVCRKMQRHGGAPKIWFTEWCGRAGPNARCRP